MANKKKPTTPGMKSTVSERAATITIGDKDYELVLTTRATREIAARYGGLENLGAKLEGAEHFEQALAEIIWLITLLANQSILIHNLHAQEDQPLLSTEEIELLTAPGDLADYRSAIAEALYRGTKREVISEPDPKNG